jgi:hypothetical protein
MRLAEIAPPSEDNQLLLYAPDCSSQHAKAVPFISVIQAGLQIPDAATHDCTKLPAPEQFATYAPRTEGDGTLVFVAGGGDGTLTRVLGAGIGHVRDNPEATAANLEQHREILRRSRGIILPGGNANNGAHSTLKHHVKHPEQLAGATDLYVGEHQPLLASISDEGETVRWTRLMATCIGLGATEHVIARIEKHRQQLRHLDRVSRFAAEGALTFAGLWRAPAFDARISFGPKNDPSTEILLDINGISLIRTLRYAKIGRTLVNMDRTRLQPIVSDYQYEWGERVHDIRDQLLRVRIGAHKRDPLDFADAAMHIRVDRDTPIEVDGDIDETSVLHPGETLTLKLSRLAVPLIMAA